MTFDYELIARFARKGEGGIEVKAKGIQSSVGRQLIKTTLKSISYVESENKTILTLSTHRLDMEDMWRKETQYDLNVNSEDEQSWDDDSNSTDCEPGSDLDYYNDSDSDHASIYLNNIAVKCMEKRDKERPELCSCNRFGV